MKRMALMLVGITMLPMALGCCGLHHGCGSGYGGGYGSGYGYGAGCPTGNCGPGGYVPGTLGAPSTYPSTYPSSTQAVPPGGAYLGGPGLAQFGAPAGVPVTVSQPIQYVSGYADPMPRKSLPTF